MFSTRSKTSNTQLGRKRKYEEKNMLLKPFGFCCSIDNFDPLSKYDKQPSIHKSSLMSVHAVNESPTLKFRTQFTGYIDPEQKKKTPKNKNYVTNKRNLNNVGDHKHKTYIKHKIYTKHKHKSHNSHNFEDLQDQQILNFLQGPIQWYLEDEVALAKDILWAQKQKAHNEEMDKNIHIGKQRAKLTMEEEVNIYPRWYQDFSIDQMKNLMILQCVMHKDCEERVIGRTQRTLVSIGIISTFFTLTSDAIKKLQKSCNCNVIDFLREVYKVLTGNYFEEEGYKKFYDCNERIILSAIAFLTLPETIMELHKRLPPVIMPKLPPKPMLPVPPIRQKMESPYEEELFIRPDWASYYNHLQYWQEQCQLKPLPKVILPPKSCILTDYKDRKVNSRNEKNKNEKLENVFQNNQLIHAKYNPSIHTKQRHNISYKGEQKKNIPINKNQKYDVPVKLEEKAFAYSFSNNPIKVKQKDTNNSFNNSIVIKENDNPTNTFNVNSTKLQQKNSSFIKEIHDIDNSNEESEQENIIHNIIDSTSNTEQKILQNTQKLAALDIPPLYGGNRLFDFTINGISEKPGPVEYKICGILQPPQPNKKSWLDEKHAHYIISGAADEPPTCPVTYEMTGVANVTPTNSDERFFAVLKLGDGPKKIYPGGRKNLSRHWQEWLQNVDEEFRKVEREANKMIKSIEAITKLVFPGPTCDSCCSCRQTRKSYLKAKETKAPYFVIDTIAEDNNKNKYIVGSMAMHSPAPTPPESTVNLLEVIASEDILTTNLIISGVTNEKGETQYFISGAKEDTIRVPARIVERPPPPPPRNVPPCICAIQQIFNKGLTPTLSHDHIPWTKEDGLCFGKKFRPNEYPAYSCKMYPGDKSCRRNPFMNEIIRLKKRAERKKQKEQKDASSSQKKRMYSIADFQPCGDEHGMGICGGPWGALHTLTPEELAAQEKLQKEILRGPPCGTKPGRAVCEGPFGKRIPLKRPQIEIEEEILGEEEEEDFEEEEEEEERKEEEQQFPVKEEKKRKRDQKCYMSPDSIAGRKKIVEKKVEKFIPDPTYPGYDDAWNIFRTAPSKKESETDFKKLLKLSSPKPPATPIESKILISENDPSISQKNISESNTKKVSPENSKQSSSVPIQKVSKQISKKKVFTKSRNNEKVAKTKSKSTDKKEIQTATKTISDEIIKNDKTDSKIKDQKFLKPIRSKHSYKKINSKAMSFKNLKKGNKVDQIRRIPKQTAENIKLKPKREKTGSLHERQSKRFGVRIQKNKKSILEKSKRNESTKCNKKNIQHLQFNNKSEQKLTNSTNVKIDKQDKKGKGKKQLSHRSILSQSIGKKKASKLLDIKKKFIKRDKKKDVQTVQDVDSDMLQKDKIQNLKNILKSSNIYPYDVKPVVLPEEPPAKCQVEYEDTETLDNSIKTDEDADVQLPSKGPCGWRTKSEQKLPTKKTLVYLTELDYPPEMIPVRPGGKPCVCRENRAKKKILLYNIGGLIGGKKDDKEKKLLKKKKDEDDKKMQVIDGVIYYTPPPSPRRSDEYVPEYDLYDSPYDMCLTQRKDKNLKFLEQYSRPKVSKDLKNKESCGCNEYIDTYGIQTTDQHDEKAQTMKELDRTREELIDMKSPKERWKLALKDVGLMDYFTRCRDSIPCWLKCTKFNNIGCALPYRKLKTKRPVCECKYERKILEHKEEKLKWKERRKKLKSLKKQPFTNIVNISKPVVADTKLMISGVKRIPKEDEYIDDVKYCITGVAENYSELPSKPIVGGVHMSTPIQTPKQSIEKLPCICLHRHWSPTNILPGPLPKSEEILLADKKRRQEAVIAAFKQIYTPQEVYDMHEGHSCRNLCKPNSNIANSDIENKEVIKENDKVAIQNDDHKIKSHLQQSMKTVNKSVSPKQIKQSKFKLNDNNNENKLNIKNIMTQKTAEIITKSPDEMNKNIENEVNNPKNSHNLQKYEHKKIKDDTQLQNELTNLKTENVDISDKEIDENSDDTESQLMTMAQNELKKMASEGFLFAKLPQCFLMPQLQYWLIYRKGIALSDVDRNNSVRKSIMIWNMLDVRKSHKIEPPSLQMTKLQLRNLTFDNAEEMKEKIAMKKEIFYSQVRKERVLYGRSMWNTMEYGKFPSTLFKQAYFTYMANKEADGHVFKPWLRSEARDVN